MREQDNNLHGTVNHAEKEALEYEDKKREQQNYENNQDHSLSGIAAQHLTPNGRRELREARTRQEELKEYEQKHNLDENGKENNKASSSTTHTENVHSGRKKIADQNASHFNQQGHGQQNQENNKNNFINAPTVGEENEENEETNPQSLKNRLNPKNIAKNKANQLIAPAKQAWERTKKIALAVKNAALAIWHVILFLFTTPVGWVILILCIGLPLIIMLGHSATQTWGPNDNSCMTYDTNGNKRGGPGSEGGADIGNFGALCGTDADFNSSNKDLVALNIIDWFMSNTDWGAAQIAAIVGNMYIESAGFKWDVWGGTHTASCCYGIVQWAGGRFTALQSLASSMGSTWKDPVVQLRHIVNEVNSAYYHGQLGSEFFTTTDITVATKRWARHYEVCYTGAESNFYQAPTAGNGWQGCHGQRRIDAAIRFAEMAQNSCGDDFDINNVPQNDSTGVSSESSGGSISSSGSTYKSPFSNLSEVACPVPKEKQVFQSGGMNGNINHGMSGNETIGSSSSGGSSGGGGGGGFVNNANNGKMDPSQLVRISKCVTSTANSCMLLPAAAASWERMVKDSRGVVGYPNESYRSLATQQLYWYWAQHYMHNMVPGQAAYPGTSPHGLGRAIDIGGSHGNPAQAWIRQHGSQYGWTVNNRCHGQVGYECWHFNFNG